MEAMDSAVGGHPTPTPGLNQYSCLPCRKKKRKCDRFYPCQNCQKSNTTCTFRPRKPSTRLRAPTSAMERLRHLERIIGKLRNELEAQSSPPRQGNPESDEESAKQDMSHDSDHPPHEDESETNDLECHVGKLAIAGGKSRYIINSYWGNAEGLMDKLEDLEDLLAAEISQPAFQSLTTTPSSTATNTSLIFGKSPCFQELMGTLPPPGHMSIYWRLFKENCDPLIKVLHVPSVEPLILQNTSQQSACHVDALRLAISFSVIVSLDATECLQIFGQRKRDVIERFRSGMECALSRANLLVTEQIVVLQAFVIYLTGLRNHCEIRMMWTLTALAVRLAQNAGLHRDGTHFKLTPFEIEMRRRLWWAICVLDSRASEDSGYDVAIPHNGVDTQLPLHVNDSSLHSEMKSFPGAQNGCTEMTFSMVRCEATSIFRRLQYTTSQAERSICNKTESIERCQARLHEVYLKYLDSTRPFGWFVLSVSKIVSTKMWLVAHHPLLQKGAACPHELIDVKDKLFVSAIECVEVWVHLNTNARTSRWRWLCETYIQWYALTFLLLELCNRTEGALVDQAWSAVEDGLKLALHLSAILSEGNTSPMISETHMPRVPSDVFKPLGKLFRSARAARLRGGHTVSGELTVLMSNCIGNEFSSFNGSTMNGGLDQDGLSLTSSVYNGIVSDSNQLDAISALPSLPPYNVYNGWELSGTFFSPVAEQADLTAAPWSDWVLPEGTQYL